ncbi:type VI secretion system ATPase TssH [Isosphaeraceae bacterium EP7]
MALDSGALIRTLNTASRDALMDAANRCLVRTNRSVEVEHWLSALVDGPDADVPRILRYFDISPAHLGRDINRALDALRTGNDRTPALAEPIADLIREAWLLASVQFGLAKVRTGTLLLALVSDPALARLARGISPELAKVSPEALAGNFLKIVAGSPEDESPADAGRASSPSTADATSPMSTKSPALDQYTVDLTARARAGKIDPVLGRDSEVRQMVDILIRRRQNNPILTGEAGVGKTAVVEGFARRIAAGDVPPALANVSLRTLDLGLLQAGAGVKGEFENRLKQVIEEVKASTVPIILFIDEAHTLIGAGGQAGQNDAANLLKPALARGDLRTIAATTWAEYKKYFEKDAALARRFQVVKVEEPAEDRAIEMMRGITGMLEAHHGVRILDEAVEASVKFSARYIPGRQLPDKSVSLLDTACARVAISQGAIPPAVEDARRRIEVLDVEIGILRREAASGAPHVDRLAERDEDLEAAKARLAALEARWEAEKTVVARVRALREQIEARHAQGQGDDAALADLEAATAELRALQGESPLMHTCVDGQAIAEVVAGWTGIPVGKMLADEIHTLLNLQDRLGERVIGQAHALHAIAQRVRTSRANLTDPRRPVGVFLLVGPSGVGKTETALALADALYGGERNLVTINMSEYQESHTVSGLKGSPPGYVGYGEGGVLTEAVRRKPYSVVLLDEVEKAHPDVMELFFQVFDKGLLEDGEGRAIDFKNTIILLTSNVGTATVMALCADPETAPDPGPLAESIRPDLLKAFPPALLGRMITVPYYPISDDVMRRIIGLQLGHIAARLKKNHKSTFTYSDALIDAVAARCLEVDSGARNVDHILTRSLLPELSEAILARMASGQSTTSVNATLDSDGKFTYEIA